MTGEGKEQVFIVACRECGQTTRIDLSEMAVRLDDVEALEKLKARLQCKCGSTRLHLTAVWK